MIAASSLSDLLHSCENMVGTIFSVTKYVSRDAASPYTEEISKIRDKVKIEWKRCIQDRKSIYDQLASSHPSSANLVFEGGAEGTKRRIQRSITGLED